MTKSEQDLKNEFELLCKECKSPVINPGMAVSCKFKFPREALQEIDIKLASKPSAEFKKEVDPVLNIEDFSNLKVIVKFEDWKPKEDIFDIAECNIEDIEDYDNFVMGVKECWKTENLFDLENVAVQRNKSEKTARGPIFCGHCYSKEEKSFPVKIIGWTNNYAHLKPVYIMADKLINKK